MAPPTGFSYAFYPIAVYIVRHDFKTNNRRTLKLYRTTPHATPNQTLELGDKGGVANKTANINVKNRVSTDVNGYIHTAKTAKIANVTVLAQHVATPSTKQ